MNAADRNFNQTLKFQPNTDLVKVWYATGEYLANSSKYIEALNCFNQVVEIQPQDRTAWVRRGVMLIHLERYQEALASCEIALEIQPTDKQAWLFRGVALNYLGRYKQCYASYDKALGIERRSLLQKLIQTLKGIFKSGTSGTTLVIGNR